MKKLIMVRCASVIYVPMYRPCSRTLPQIQFASHHFEFLVDMKAFPDAVAAYLPTELNQNDHPLVPICSDWLRVKVNKCPAHLFTGRFNQYVRVLA